MSAHAYSEDQLVEQPAIGLFAELGWQTVSAMEEIFGGTKPSPRPFPSGRGSDAGPANLGRETSGEVVMAQRLKVALEKLNPGLPSDAIASALDELQRRREILETTDMAVIVSPGQNEIEQMKKLGLDIVAHRKRMNESEPPLDEKFKDSDDPLRIAFVCAMWLTGFDAPSCSTVYLDKPIRNHTLMQAIARANRVFPGKHSGVIVDYANVFASLEKALAIYGAGKDGKTPVRDKQKLVEELRKAIAAVTAFCDGQGVSLAAIEGATKGSMDRLALLDDAVNALISPDALRKDFFAHERFVKTLYDAVKPDPVVIEFTPRVSCLKAIGDAIRETTTSEPVDISAVLGQINDVLDDSIEGIRLADKPPPTIDLSKIDFEALGKRFEKAKRKNIALEELRAAIRAQLDKLIRLNRTRIDFQDKFEELIESYNNGS
jgi:type I restriction enzyme R subunit